MNKKHIVFGLFFFITFVLSIPGAAITSDTEYDHYNLTIQPGTDETELSFTWFTTDTSGCQLMVCNSDEMEEGELPASPDVYAGYSEVVDDTTYACKVTITDVEDNTNYAYIVGNGEESSEIYYFDTKNPENFNFIFVGDPQIGASRGDNNVLNDAEDWAYTVTAALTNFEDTSFILSAGDQINRGSSSNEKYDGFFSAAELTSVPFAPTIGNHDVGDLYAYHFNVSNESDLGYTNGGGDYWFTYDKTLFIVLNTNNTSAVSHSEFMAQAIEANPDATWRVVVFHHALYSSARHVDDVNNRRTSMYPVIDTYDIDVVLSGHDHFYARTHQLSGGEVVTKTCYDKMGRGGQPTEVCVDLIGDVIDEADLYYSRSGQVLNPSGTVYITANSASGSKYYDFTDIEGYTNLYLAAYEQLYTPSYLNVEVNRYRLTISAYYVDEATGESEMFDTYSIVKIDNFPNRGR